MKYFLITLFALLSFGAYSQTPNRQPDNNWKGSATFGTGSDTWIATDPSAALQVGENNGSKGLLLPRVADTNAVSNPAFGLQIFSLSDSTIYFYSDHWVGLENSDQLDSLYNSSLFNFNQLGSYMNPPIIQMDSGYKMREIGNVLSSGDSLTFFYSRHYGSYADTNVYIAKAVSYNAGKSFIDRGLISGVSSISAEDPYCIQVSDTFYLYSEAKKDTSIHPTPQNGIQLFVSVDLNNWINRGIVFPDTTGSIWEGNDRSSPTVLYKDSIFYMFYEGRGTGNAGAVGLATSKDGYQWTENPNNPIITGTNFPDSTILWCNEVVPDDIIKIDSTYFMSAHAYTSGNFQTAFIISKDLINWQDLNGDYITTVPFSSLGDGVMYLYNKNQLSFLYVSGGEDSLINGYGKSSPSFSNYFSIQKAQPNTITGSWTFSADKTTFGRSIDVGALTANQNSGINMHYGPIVNYFGNLYSTLNPGISYNAYYNGITPTWTQGTSSRISMLFTLGYDGNLYLYKAPMGQAPGTIGNFFTSKQIVLTKDSSDNLYLLNGSTTILKNPTTILTGNSFTPLSIFYNTESLTQNKSPLALQAGGTIYNLNNPNNINQISNSGQGLYAYQAYLLDSTNTDSIFLPLAASQSIVNIWDAHVTGPDTISATFGDTSSVSYHDIPSGIRLSTNIGRWDSAYRKYADTGLVWNINLPLNNLFSSVTVPNRGYLNTFNDLVLGGIYAQDTTHNLKYIISKRVGLYIKDLYNGAIGIGASITNPYAIFQEGFSDTSVFNGFIRLGQTKNGSTSDSVLTKGSDGTVHAIAQTVTLSDSASISGDGTTTNFTVSVSPGWTPTKVFITPTSVDAAKAAFYVSGITSTGFTVTSTGTMPPSGTNNVTFYYQLVK